MTPTLFTIIIFAVIGTLLFWLFDGGFRDMADLWHLIKRAFLQLSKTHCLEKGCSTRIGRHEFHCAEHQRPDVEYRPTGYSAEEWELFGHADTDRAIAEIDAQLKQLEWERLGKVTESTPAPGIRVRTLTGPPKPMYSEGGIAQIYSHQSDVPIRTIDADDLARELLRGGISLGLVE